MGDRLVRPPAGCRKSRARCSAIVRRESSRSREVVRISPGDRRLPTKSHPPEDTNVRLFHIVAAALVSVGMSSNAQAQHPLRRTPPSCNLAPAPGVEQQLSSGGRQRTYRLFVPQGSDGRTRLPLVLDLHGSGGTSAGQARTSGFETLAAREGFVVATLQAEGGRWNVPVTDGRAGRRRLCLRRHRPRRGAGVHGPRASLCHGLLRRRAHVVAPRVPAQHPHRGDRADGRPPLARPLPGAPRSGT